MHWWAAHGASGVNFQNTEWLRTDTFYRDLDGNYQMHPKAYGIRAFDLGGRGRVESVAIENKPELNLTAYAVSNATNLCVTIINKEHGASGRGAKVKILPGFTAKDAAVMVLAAREGGVEATSGVTLGGGMITNNAAWVGKWIPLEASTQGCVVTIAAASAAVVKISR